MHHPPSRALPRVAMPALALSATLLAACAPLQTRDNLRAANAIVQPRIGQEAQLWTDAEAQQQAQSRIDALLREPLSADAAVRIALLGSPALQTLLAQNAAQSAASTRNARLGNPVLGFERLLQGGSVEITRSLSFGLLDLVTLPVRGRIDAARQQQLRLDLARDVLRLAAQARASWVRALAAQQALQYDNDVEDAASATAELAKRMQAAGNFTKLDAGQQALFAADSRMRAQRAQLAALRAREALVRTLGLNAAQAAKLRLPEHLPDIPAALPTARQDAQQALEARLDVQLARAQYEAAARTAGFVRTTSVVDALELTGIRKTFSDATPQNGFALALPLPVFDPGDAQRAEASAQVLAARNHVAEVVPHARYAHLEEALVLEEIQMPIALHRGVIDGMLPWDPRHSKPCTGLEVYRDGQRAGLRIEGHIAHKPRRFNPQSRLKELRFRHHRHSSLGTLAVFYP